MAVGIGIQPTLCQIAITTLNMERSVRFYSDLLGFSPTGWIPIRGRTAAQLLQEARVEGECHWLAGEPKFFQLEFFQFQEPSPRRSRGQPYDYGYTRITVEVQDLDRSLTRTLQLGATLIKGVTVTGDSMRACVRDPDGVLIELIKGKDGRVDNHIVGVGATVDDLEDTRRYYCDALGLTQRNPVGPDRDLLWHGEALNTDVVNHETLTLAAGEYWLELTRYDGAPSGSERRRPRLTSQGLMNIGLGIRTAAEFHQLYRHAILQGYQSATKPIGGGLSHTVYLRNDEGMSVELLQLPEVLESLWGFSRPGVVGGLVQRGLRFMLQHQR